jgi:uncharacterized glyoxalase superfamily protein PhnB
MNYRADVSSEIDLSIQKEQNEMKKITPFLWFDTQAEEAMNFYVSVFKDSKVLGVSRGPDGRAQSVNFELEGQEFIGFNAGPEFKFNEAISWIARLKKKWTSFGTSSLPMAARKVSAAG